MCAVSLVLSFNQSGDSISDDAMSDQHLVTKFPVMLSRRRGVVVSVLALHAGVLSSNRVLLPYSSILLFLIVVAEFTF